MRRIRAKMRPTHPVAKKRFSQGAKAASEQRGCWQRGRHFAHSREPLGFAGVTFAKCDLLPRLCDNCDVLERHKNSLSRVRGILHVTSSYLSRLEVNLHKSRCRRQTRRPFLYCSDNFFFYKIFFLFCVVFIKYEDLIPVYMFCMLVCLTAGSPLWLR